MARKYWLMKSEPEVFSIHDLGKAKDQTTFWDGVRNFQARNFMRDEMQVGDGVLFYHSNADPSGVAGTATVAKTASPDPSQFDPASEYHDPRSSPDDPRWLGVHIRFESAFRRFVPLDELRATPALRNMVLLHRSRLSVQPVTAAEWSTIVKLGARATA